MSESRQVRETKAGLSISAWVVLNKKGEHVANVNAHFSDSGTTRVDVWNIGDKAVLRCYDAAMSTLHQPARAAALAKAKADALAKYDWRKADNATNWAAHDLFGLQQGRAGGYGYDKLAAALAGLWIDGHKLANHSGQDAQTEKLFRAYVKQAVKRVEEGKQNGFHAEWQKDWDAKAKKIGAYFTNYSSARFAYQSLFLHAGLKRLEILGYTVIQAI